MPQHSRLLMLIALVCCLPACGSSEGNDDDNSGPCNLLAGDAQPEVFIDAPDNGDLVSQDDAINWLVRVQDEDSDIAEVSLLALDLSTGTPSAIDFDLPAPDEDGVSTFTLSGDILGSGVIVVRIEATDGAGCKGDDGVVLCIDVPSSECDF
jgi:hypothetical protein